jgi:hypothetical protein
VSLVIHNTKPIAKRFNDEASGRFDGSTIDDANLEGRVHGMHLRKHQILTSSALKQDHTAFYMSSLLKDFPEMYIDLRLAVKKRFISRS